MSDTTIHSLPPDMLVVIFNMTPLSSNAQDGRKIQNWQNIALTCKRWNEIIMQNGFDFSVDEYLPLRLAIRNGRGDVVEMMMDHPSVDPSRLPLSVLAAMSEDDHMSAEILKQRDPLLFSIEAQMFSGLFVGWARKGHEESIKVLLERMPSVDVTIDQHLALRIAAECGHTSIVKILLKDGRCDPTIYDSFPLRSAAERGHREVVEVLLQDGRADRNVFDNYPERFARSNGHVDVADLIRDFRATLQV
ncbi:ankyrin-3-like [Planoprotostelium fungivorum]|uniref:Ankyrin-3-like n=1 Tax=Planoprotostelium fungivorum TaxID=1890364 RepID=A0A2P6MZ44_9EUKA|nr:ankyrin-3-like [Planoprotostelium fungivorum]